MKKRVEEKGRSRMLAIFGVAVETDFSHNDCLASQGWIPPAPSLIEFCSYNLAASCALLTPFCLGLSFLAWSGLMSWSGLWGRSASAEIGRLWTSTICANSCGVPWFLANMRVVLLTAFHATWGVVAVILIVSVFRTSMAC